MAGARARATALEFLGGTYRSDFASMLDRVACVGDLDQVMAEALESRDRKRREDRVAAEEAEGPLCDRGADLVFQELA